MIVPEKGQQVGEYVLDEFIGRGAFGEVWRAYHHAWRDRVVAVKIPTDPDYIRQLQREGQNVQSLDHPGIVKAIGFAPYADPPYLISEYVPGTTLRALVGKLRVDDAVEIIRQILQAVGYAHAQGVVHRDLKPENVLIHRDAAQMGYDMPGMVKLTDFGLGKANAATARSMVMSQSIEGPKVVGTINYMSPEQRRGEAVDGRSDLYSIGIMLYEMLTGKIPESMELPSALNPSVPPHVDQAFKRAFVPVDRRFGSAEHFREALVWRAMACAGEIVSSTASVQGRAAMVMASEAPVATVAVPRRPSRSKGGRGKAGAWTARVTLATALLIALLVWLGISSLTSRTSAQPSPFVVLLQAVQRAAREGANTGLYHRGQAEIQAEAKRQAEAERRAEAERMAEAVRRMDMDLRANAKLVTLELAGGVVLKLVRIEPGTYTRGSPIDEAGREDDETQHEVEISKVFYLGLHEVTVAQWRAVMGSFPGHLQHYTGNEFALAPTTWNNAVEMCRTLSEKTGKRFRLPTEAEWEYACRAGTQTPFNTGQTLTMREANIFHRTQSNFAAVQRLRALPVCSFKPNAWGLYDMHGGVGEWCSDLHGAYPRGPVKDPTGAADGVARVIRGGTFANEPAACRSARRRAATPDSPVHDVGLRLAMDP